MRLIRIAGEECIIIISRPLCPLYYSCSGRELYRVEQSSLFCKRFIISANVPVTFREHLPTAQDLGQAVADRCGDLLHLFLGECRRDHNLETRSWLEDFLTP